MNKKMVAVAVILLAALSGCKTETPEKNWSKLNSKAADEYLEPIRPGYEGRNPYWNIYAKKFTYAPAFDFKEVEGADSYRFVVTDANGKDFSFNAKSPHDPLSPVWNDIPVGDTRLCVLAVNKDGQVLDTAGTRKFFRDFPFQGPYHEATLPYRESAIKAAYFIHKMPSVQYWLDHTEPDMSYNLNTYATKIIGATVINECIVAKEIPSLREEALTMARNAAEFLIAQSRPEEDPLAFIPPTYYQELVSSGREENKDKTMTMEACRAVDVFLTIYDETKDERYFKQAIGIMNSLQKLQRPDGSLPIKVDFITGEPVNDVGAMLGPFVSVIQRLEKDYGINDYDKMRTAAEDWMRKVAVSTFNMTGQFEDVSVLGLHMYENLTNCTAAPYARYLLGKDVVSPEDLADAIDLIRLSEDQFVYWDFLPNKNGIKPFCAPCVFEQYKYEMAVDNSSCNVANAYLSLYEETGDRLAYAKGKALIDNLTIVQDQITGRIPTLLAFRGKMKEYNTFFWINCCVASIQTLLRMDKIAENE
ncbi:MAG: hypothetical protein IJ205_00100 [Bacteroidales bacterium]|nr:hypothetical protein [Bacteroidales bacterium]